MRRSSNVLTCVQIKGASSALAKGDVQSYQRGTPLRKLPTRRMMIVIFRQENSSHFVLISGASSDGKNYDILVSQGGRKLREAPVRTYQSHCIHGCAIPGFATPEFF